MKVIELHCQWNNPTFCVGANVCNAQWKVWSEWERHARLTCWSSHFRHFMHMLLVKSGLRYFALILIHFKRKKNELFCKRSKSENTIELIQLNPLESRYKTCAIRQCSISSQFIVIIWNYTMTTLQHLDKLTKYSKQVQIFSLCKLTILMSDFSSYNFHCFLIKTCAIRQCFIVIIWNYTMTTLQHLDKLTKYSKQVQIFSLCKLTILMSDFSSYNKLIFIQLQPRVGSHQWLLPVCFSEQYHLWMHLHPLTNIL